MKKCLSVLLFVLCMVTAIAETSGSYAEQYCKENELTYGN